MGQRPFGFFIENSSVLVPSPVPKERNIATNATFQNIFPLKTLLMKQVKEKKFHVWVDIIKKEENFLIVKVDEILLLQPGYKFGLK